MILGGGLLIGLTIGAVVFMGLPTLNGANIVGIASAPATAEGTPAPAPIVGSPAPDFTLNNTNGKLITLADLKGKPVLINFWATWCAPCRTEMPAIEVAYQKYRADGFTVLAVDADEALADVTAFKKDLNLSFEFLMDPGLQVTNLYRVRAFPSSFFVDRGGNIAAFQIGAMSDSVLADSVAKILK